MSRKSLGKAWAHRPLEYFTSSSSSFSFSSGLRVAGEEGGLGDDGVVWGEQEPERVGWVLGVVFWVGDCAGLSVGVFEFAAGAEVELRMGGVEEVVVVCSLAG